MDNLLIDGISLAENSTFPSTTQEVTSFPSTTPEVTSTPPPEFPDYVGFICSGVSVLFFGSNFIPVKQFKTGDGQIEAPLIFVFTI